MKGNFTLLLLCLAMTLRLPAQVAINSDGSTPTPSSMLDVKSTNNGILIPRLTTAQRLAIVSPAEGLLVYDTDLGAFSYYHSGAWILNLTNSSGWSLTGNSGTNPATNFLGTRDGNTLVFKVNNQVSGIIEPSGNASFGYQSFSSNVSGINSTAIGSWALKTNSSGSNNTAVGNQALWSNNGSWNTAIGTTALLGNNCTGSENTAIGAVTLYNNNSGSQNIAIGSNSLYHNYSGNVNTAIGEVSLYSNYSGNNNCAFGSSTLYNNTTGYSNIAIGVKALTTNVTQGNLVAVGDSALMNNTGAGNTAIGSKCLLTNTSGTNNTALGYHANVAGDNLTNSTAIGNGAVASSSNEIRLGNDAVSSLYCKGAYTSTTTNSANVYVSSAGQIMRTTSTASASSCIDIDGNGYPTFLIGTQVWMAENLRVTHYRNGEEIPNVTDATAWAALTTGAYCWPGNSQSVSAKYGVFYNHYTVTDSRQLCPTGWHVPSNAEWTALSTYLGGESVAGGKMKSVSALWSSPNTDATNNSGFSGLPAGYRDASGVFQPAGEFPPPAPGVWWTSSFYCTIFPCPQTISYDRSLHYDAATLTNGHDGNKFGFSVRCLRD